MGFQHGPSELPNSAGEARDTMNLAQGGFRFDWTGARDTVTLQGDAYFGEQEDIPGQLRPTTIAGGNVLSRWMRQLTNDSSVQAQLYYDRARRTLITGILSTVDTVQLDGQYDVQLGSHSLVMGAGVRVNEDEFVPGPGTVQVEPPRQTLRMVQGFLQDTIALSPNVDLTIGLKLEENTFTDLEYMPSARLAWRLSDDHFIWGAVSRVVRTPSRFEVDIRNLPIFAGGPDFHSEELVAYEAGLRMRPTESSRLSVAVYVNEYDELRTIEADPVTTFPLTVQNRMSGQTAGVEVWADYFPAAWWRITAGLNLLHKDLELEPGSLDVQGVSFAGNDPDYQITLRSSIDLGNRTLFDLSVRAVDALPDPVVPSYIAVDARLAWRITENAEIALSGYNLFDDAHPEFANPAIGAREIPRAVLLSTSWRF
jgi:iron complex outermembrane receptor protein